MRANEHGGGTAPTPPVGVPPLAHPSACNAFNPARAAGRPAGRKARPAPAARPARPPAAGDEPLTRVHAYPPVGAAGPPAPARRQSILAPFAHFD